MHALAIFNAVLASGLTLALSPLCATHHATASFEEKYTTHQKLFTTDTLFKVIHVIALAHRSHFDKPRTHALSIFEAILAGGFTIGFLTFRATLYGRAFL